MSVSGDKSGDETEDYTENGGDSDNADVVHPHAIDTGYRSLYTGATRELHRRYTGTQYLWYTGLVLVYLCTCVHRYLCTWYTGGTHVHKTQDRYSGTREVHRRYTGAGTHRMYTGTGVL